MSARDDLIGALAALGWKTCPNGHDIAYSGPDEVFCNECDAELVKRINA